MTGRALVFGDNHDDEGQTMTAEEASKRIVAAFEAGIAPWSRSSRLRLTCGLSLDAATRQPIRGVNTWLLELAAIEQRFRNRFWASREQWEDLGGVVVRGEGTPVIDDGIGSQTDEERILFNLEQVEVRRGAPVAALERFWVAPPTFPDYELARRLVDATGARVVTDKRCRCVVSSDPSRDFIGMRPLDLVWDDNDLWWSVLFHELVHWVVLGFQRLSWRGEYSQGELIAEIGATILTNRCGIPMRGEVDAESEHERNWIEGIREDFGYLAHACEVAELAASLVLNPFRWELWA